MEQNEYFKQVEATINKLEQQLASFVNSSECEKSAVEAEKEIEAHFANIINSLAARKAVLLKEVAQKVKEQKVYVEETRAKLETTIEASKQTLKGTSMMYSVNRNMAEVMWKEMANVSILPVHDMRIKVELTGELLDIIQLHGRVLDFRRFSIADSVTTLAGSGSAGKVDGTGPNASFNYPHELCSNANDECLYVCDYSNGSIRKITKQGVVSTLASDLTSPAAITLSHKENVFYIACSNNVNKIMKLTPTGTASVFVGNGTAAHADGAGNTASFNYPRGIAIDQKTGTVFVGEWNNHTIRKITPQGEVSTLAGSPKNHGFADGRAAKFAHPWGLWYDDQSQSLLVCDYNNSKLRRVQLNGDVSTVCDVQGPAAVVVTANGTILVSSNSGHKIFKITQKGQKYEAEVLAGSGKAKRVDGAPDKCGFNGPIGIAVHEPSQSCFVADYNSHTIRKIAFANLM